MTYKLFGALGSPYSMKIRSQLRYRRIRHLWVDGSAARKVLAHVDDMSGVEGEWEQGFAPVVAELVRIAGNVYVPFLRANADAADAGEATFRMEAMGLPYEQGTFKYQIKCLRQLQARYGALDGAAARRWTI